ncbi:ATP phosphoribosyltransferase regulatory subunit [Limisalsivibrio acetivorans]|uniref:ATP phosphoribosyltransferase regulatory subunit n=1 Tax=Limisalsivibrio acetivorans TaxID=1304888 RepID=UPI0003B492F8|nr:ATP phosphoribosyltransferase regulatory subunit [Limisalsivibrio acetivorans]
MTQGITNIAPMRAKKLNDIEKSLRGVLNSYGYMEIFLPIYDYYDMLSRTAMDFKDENIIRFIDRNTGKSLVLRPDFTPQVCRYAANYMEGFPLPLRLGYRGRVFRNVNLDKGVKAEKLQVGCELFGMSELAGDTELILIADRGMKALGLSGYRFVAGDIRFTETILEMAGGGREELLGLLSAKNVQGIKDFASNAGLTDGDTAFLASLPFAYGGMDVIDELIRTAPAGIAKERLEYIKSLFSQLISLGVDESMLVFDAAETTGHDYYTGLAFEILHDSVGGRVGSGGRYDNLAGKFGFNVSACGMAFNVEEIIHIDKPVGETAEFDYIVKGDLAKAEELRSEGKSVMFIENEGEQDSFTDYYNIKEIL